MEHDNETLGQVLDVLKDLAPELAPHVHAFLHGGTVARIPLATDWGTAFNKLRRLTDFAHNAILDRAGPARIAILTTAVRLQAVVLYETVKREASGRWLLHQRS